jgi:ATP-dependent DNA helicase
MTLCSGPPNKPTFPVIVTSFEIVIADSKFLAKHKFKYMVVDEGHRLKNYNCRLLRELRTIPAEQKLLLTGMLLPMYTASSKHASIC